MTEYIARYISIFNRYPRCDHWMFRRNEFAGMHGKQ